MNHVFKETLEKQLRFLSFTPAFISTYLRLCVSFVVRPPAHVFVSSLSYVSEKLSEHIAAFYLAYISIKVAHTSLESLHEICFIKTINNVNSLFYIITDTSFIITSFAGSGTVEEFRMELKSSRNFIVPSGVSDQTTDSQTSQNACEIHY